MAIAPRDDLLRGAVYAFPTDGTLAERTAAAQKVIDAHRLWPLVEYEQALERAGGRVEDLEAEAERELYAWYEQIPSVGRAA